MCSMSKCPVPTLTSKGKLPIQFMIRKQENAQIDKRLGQDRKVVQKETEFLPVLQFQKLPCTQEATKTAPLSFSLKKGINCECLGAIRLPKKRDLCNKSLYVVSRRILSCQIENQSFALESSQKSRDMLLLMLIQKLFETFLQTDNLNSKY